MPWTLILYNWLAAALIMLIAWGICEQRKNVTVVDFIWSLGIVCSVIVVYLVLPEHTIRSAVVMLLVALWGFRLASHLWVDRVSGNKPEDGRYAKIRESAGDRASIAFFIVFQIQALFIVIFVIPIIAAMYNFDPTWRWADTLAVVIWIVAITGETIADNQLQQFKANPSHKGKTCQIGLWHYSRHPNYFFEWIQWFAYPLFAFGSGYFWWACLGPLLMYFFLLKLTGVPYTEAQALRSRADYAEYQRTTSQFLPWCKQ